MFLQLYFKHKLLTTSGATLADCPSRCQVYYLIAGMSSSFYVAVIRMDEIQHAAVRVVELIRVSYTLFRKCNTSKDRRDMAFLLLRQFSMCKPDR